MYFGRPPACWITQRKQPNSHFGKHPASPIGRFLRGAYLPPFVTERWRQKCPQGEKLRETHSASLKRAPVAGLQANRLRFLTLVAARFCFRTFRNAERLCAARNHDFDSFYSVLAGLGLPDRTAKIAEAVTSSARAPGAIVRKAKSFVIAQRARVSSSATFRRA